MDTVHVTGLGMLWYDVPNLSPKVLLTSTTSTENPSLIQGRCLLETLKGCQGTMFYMWYVRTFQIPNNKREEKTDIWIEGGTCKLPLYSAKLVCLWSFDLLPALHFPLTMPCFFPGIPD